MIKHTQNKRSFCLDSDRLPYLLLLIVGLMELVFLCGESLFSYIGYYLVEDYIIVPCLIFLGLVWGKDKSPFARRRFLLAFIAIGWFVIVQILHKISGSETHPIGTVFFIYLMAFPFASATSDDQKLGLTLIGYVFIVAAMVQVGYTLLLLWDKVPEFMYPYLYWDGARLHAFWHSNISACLFMLGIVFSLQALLTTKKTAIKILLGLLICLQFFCMALTNCRTVILLTSALFGGMTFFHMIRNSWKKCLIGFVAAVLILVSGFWLAGEIYQGHTEALKTKISAQLEKQESNAVKETEPGDTTVPASESDSKKESKKESTKKEEKKSDSAASKKETAPAEETKAEIRENYKVDNKTGEIKLVSDNNQKTFGEDLGTFSGRTRVWKSAIKEIRENSRILLWGTEDVSFLISRNLHKEYVHTHNSWLEVLMRLGIPGLLLAMIFTCIAVRCAWILVWNRSVEMSRKIIAMLTVCLLVAGMLEPYLFITNVYYHIFDFVFFFCTGYLDYWCHQLNAEKE